MDPATENRAEPSAAHPAHGDRLASALRTLSIRCHDSEAGYRRAAEDTADKYFKFEFEQLADERREMAAELNRCLEEIGHPPTEGSSPMGSAHRLYLDLKALVSRGSKKAVFREVARGEAAFEQAYDETLRLRVPESMRRRLQVQHRNVRRARDYYAALSGANADSAYATGALAETVAGRITTLAREHPLLAAATVGVSAIILGRILGGHRNSTETGPDDLRRS